MAHDGAGTGGTEFATATYVRKAATNNTTNFPSTTLATGLKYLDVDHTFANPDEDWGTAAALAIYDASAGGNMLLCQAMTETPVVQDAPPVITAGTFRITLD